MNSYVKPEEESPRRRTEPSEAMTEIAIETNASPLKRFGVLVYGIICYASFLATLLYALGFVGGFAVPKSMDTAPRGPLGLSLLVDLGLLAVFAVQHSGMARPAFKRQLVRLIPAAAERSTYVLLSSAALLLLFWSWRPLGGDIWRVEQPLGAALLYAGFAFGWGLVLVTTFAINHFDLFGLRQVWLFFRGQHYRPLRFVTPGLYRIVRHPLYLGWLCAFWFTPHMTATHLLFALVTTIYILLAIRWEERDLIDVHGAAYLRYRQRTPMIVPRLTGAPASETSRAMRST
ncbi:MAG TPA: isoprenylcysteine carboxylmethyltransferase family protein [Polyangiaceae bacterium]|nr:isoprenylcysteine carboxylmethyltransferase family protein [Polyangiaceae bacterium]